MPGSTLVAVAFLAGNTWGPTITAQQFPSAAACESVQKAISAQIVNAAKSNINGGSDIQSIDGEVVIFAAGPAKREIARLNCI